MFEGLCSAIAADLADLTARGRVSAADSLSAATGQHFNAATLPHYFTGNLHAPIVLVHLNPKQTDEPSAARFIGQVPSLQEYLDTHSHFGARIYGPNAPRTHRSPFDAKQVRFLRAFGVIDFLPEGAPDARFRNLELSVDAKAQLEVVPYGSDTFRLTGRESRNLMAHFDRLLDVVVAVERSHVLFCGAVFDTLLSAFIVHRHEFHLTKVDGTRTAGRYRFANAEIPRRDRVIRAGIASSYAVQGIPMDAYAAQCAARY